jgi:hypothetical protein
VKKILIKKCSECPYLRYNSGSGFCEPFYTCEISSDEEDNCLIKGSDQDNSDYLNTIPKWCKLEDCDELESHEINEEMI